MLIPGNASDSQLAAKAEAAMPLLTPDAPPVPNIIKTAPTVDLDKVSTQEAISAEAFSLREVKTSQTGWPGRSAAHT